MAFTPQSIHWRGKRAIVLVHGIGNASVGQAGSFPVDALKRVLGGAEPDVAIYTINYDFINDWMDQKVDFEAGINALRSIVRLKLGNEAADAAIADSVGDILWPVLSPDLRFAVRDAIIAQLDQVHTDRVESCFLNGDEEPLDYQVSLVAHSLGCFHTYEVLHAIAREPEHNLQPASDLMTFDSVVMMASPVQLIRTIAGSSAAIVPDAGSLATIARPLAIPAEQRGNRVVACTKDFISITGSHDPVGGHLLGRKLEWAYMDIPGQHSMIVSQLALSIDSKDSTAMAMAHAAATGGAQVNDPHSWTGYIDSQARQLRGLLLT